MSNNNLIGVRVDDFTKEQVGKIRDELLKNGIETNESQISRLIIKIALENPSTLIERLKAGLMSR